MIPNVKKTPEQLSLSAGDGINIIGFARVQTKRTGKSCIKNKNQNAQYQSAGPRKKISENAGDVSTSLDYSIFVGQGENPVPSHNLDVYTSSKRIIVIKGNVPSMRTTPYISRPEFAPEVGLTAPVGFPVPLIVKNSMKACPLWFSSVAFGLALAGF